MMSDELGDEISTFTMDRFFARSTENTQEPVRTTKRVVAKPHDDVCIWYGYGTIPYK